MRCHKQTFATLKVLASTSTSTALLIPAWLFYILCSACVWYVHVLIVVFFIRISLLIGNASLQGLFVPQHFMD